MATERPQEARDGDRRTQRDDDLDLLVIKATVDDSGQIKLTRVDPTTGREREASGRRHAEPEAIATVRRPVGEAIPSGAVRWWLR